MASASGVTAGLLSKADYDAFSAKQNVVSGSSALTPGSVPTSQQAGLVVSPYNN